MVKKRIGVSTSSPTRFKRRKVDHAEVYEQLKQGYRPCDIAREHGITRQNVYAIKLKMEKLQNAAS